MICNYASGQRNSFYLMPHIGLNFPFSYFADKNNVPPYIKRTKTNSDENFGLAVFADFDKNIGFLLGYEIGTVGWGIKVSSHTDSARNQTMRSSYTSVRVQRFFIRCSKNISQVRIVKSSKDYPFGHVNKYWAIFDIDIFAGFSMEHVPPVNYGSNVSFLSRPFTGTRDIIHTNDAITTLNDTGYGLQVGINLQFYNNGKRRLQLGFLYHQGINRRLKAIWSSSINGKPFPDFDQYTRGSVFAMYASYPILLFGGQQE